MSIECVSLIDIVDDAFSSFFSYTDEWNMTDEFVFGYDDDSMAVKGNRKLCELVEMFFMERLHDLFSLSCDRIVVDPLSLTFQDNVQLKEPYIWTGRNFKSFYNKLRSKTEKYRCFRIIDSETTYIHTLELTGMNNIGLNSYNFLKERQLNFIIDNEDSIKSELLRRIYRK